MEFTHIFKPIKIGSLTAKNRIEVSPAEPFLCTKDGLVTDEFIAYTAAMARGGAGIVTVGDSPVNQEYASKNHYVVNLADPFVVHGLYKLSDAIHRYGAIASIELNLRLEVFPSEMTASEIRQIIRDFADSALRCKKGGFDMVMLHGGHGHTVAQFFSPLMNKRTDEYGAATLKSRCHFANELLDAVREAIGSSMALDWRMSGDEMTVGGVGLEEAVLLAKEIENKLDIIHISAGNMYEPSSIRYTIQPTYFPAATNLHLAERFKTELSIPVTTVGSFNLPLAEQAVSENKADVVAMIRQFIADPNCVNKARSGQAELIRPCIRCCICTGSDPHGCPTPLRCSVNPVSGRNPLFDVIPISDTPKKVVVIGGGCAGLEASRRLAQRGHSVILLEKEPYLGGSLLPAGANTIKADVRRYAEWSIRATERISGIDIRTNTIATGSLVKSLSPDAVIVAVGSEPIIPDIPGIDRDNVCLASDIDLKRKKPGHRVVIIGAGSTGTETAVSLAAANRDVTLIDMLSIDEIDNRGKSSRLNTSLLRKLSDDAGVRLITGLKAKAISDEGVLTENLSADELLLHCDSVVLSLGVKPRKGFREEFDNCAETVIYIGDCAASSGNIASAVLDGFYAALNL